MHLSFPKRLPLFILASSVCTSLQCVISALTHGGGGGHFFRLTCSVMLWGGRNTANKYHWRVWGVLAVSRAHWVCPCSRRVCFPSLHFSGLGCSQGNCLRWALGCMHFPGLSCSGAVSPLLHKGADSVGPAFCALPRSEQLRRPGAWQAHSPQVGGVSYHLPGPNHSASWVAARAPVSAVPCVCLLWRAGLWLQPSRRMSTV